MPGSIPRKKIVILGSTGSIGENTLKVIDSFPDKFEVVALAAGRDYRSLAEQAQRFKPAYVAMADEKSAEQLKILLKNTSTKVLGGDEGIASLARIDDIDLVVSAIAGSPGLMPTYHAVKAGVDVALANKEPLVMAGNIIIKEAARSGSRIIPVDSEHHAALAAMRGISSSDIEAITITASGGPFIHTPAEDLEHVTIKQALCHPRWNMGKKISIDSATLMNKGLEIIEAYWLFGFSESRIRVIVHPESIIHAMVHLADGGVLAYLSRPDMRLPIAAALNHPGFLGQGLSHLEFETLGQLTFLPPDHGRFPSINLAREALRAGGTSPAVLNAANEAAVSAFLDGRIKFTDIFKIIEMTLNAHETRDAENLNDIIEEDQNARRTAQSIISKGASKGPSPETPDGH